MADEGRKQEGPADNRPPDDRTPDDRLRDDRLASDHVVIGDPDLSRRYFRQMRRITSHLPEVLAVMEAEGALRPEESAAVAEHLSALSATLAALEMKYLMAGREGARGLPGVTIDDHESGFPTAREIMTMASDGAQAARMLAQGPDAPALKRQMLEEIIGELQVPVRLQYALSQRLYHEALARGGLFWPGNEARALWLGDKGERRRYLLHWSVWDAQVNLPLIFLAEVEDSGRTALPLDDARWAELQGYLSAQSLSALTLLTIARGWDTDFPDLHPKRLRRIHVGPMHSRAFTRQTGPVAAVLEGAGASEEEDWVLAWSWEELVSDRVVREKAGWFGQVDREVYALDSLRAEAGVSRAERVLILPARPYQVLVEQAPPGLAQLRKYVLGENGRVLGQR